MLTCVKSKSHRKTNMNLGYRLINLGVTSEISETEEKKIKVLNFCCSFGFLTAVFFLIFDLFLNQLDSLKLYSFLFQVVVFIIIYFLQYKECYNIARIIFLGLVFGTLFYNSNIAFKGFYAEYSYIILPLLALFFFDNKRLHYSVLLIAIVSFYIPNIYLEIYEEENFGYLNVLFLFMGTFLIVNYFKKQNKKNEFRLKLAYVELEDKRRNELAHLQLKSLKAQMNPHFMFNAMNSIQALILKENKHEAYEYLTKFASLIRENLNMSEKSFVYFEEELSLLKKYLELEKLRFQNNFEYKISGIENIRDIKIPSMIIQPFIENAIKHGLLHKTDGVKKVTIEFYQDEVLKCIVIDNGIGIQKSKEINILNNKEASFSTRAIHDRLGLLKDYYKTDIGFTYEKVKQGTKVIIKIPYVNLDE
ncbi:Histidine kinase [Tenacibaculum sp. 190524A02b]